MLRSERDAVIPLHTLEPTRRKSDLDFKLEPDRRFELLTFRLQGGCSTTELIRRVGMIVTNRGGSEFSLRAD